MTTEDQAADPTRQAIERFVGRRLGPYQSYNSVNRAQIWQWCSAMSDHNPRYLPQDDSPATAPPAMMQMWTMRNSHFRYAPGSVQDEPFEVLAVLKELGCGGNVAVSYDLRFHRYLQEGDRVHSYSTISHITELKKTALGEGYFITELAEYLDQNESCFAEATISYFAYRPAEKPQAARNEDSGKAPASASGVTADTLSCNTGAPPKCAEGDMLPTLAIPINATLIVAGAVASQDFTEVHHDYSAAREAGMNDIFMNILTTCGLSSRYLTDWAGPEAELQTLSFRLFAPNTPGDCMRFTGEIKEAQHDDDASFITIDFKGSNALGLHVAGQSRLKLP